MTTATEAQEIHTRPSDSPASAAAQQRIIPVLDVVAIDARFGVFHIAPKPGTDPQHLFPHIRIEAALADSDNACATRIAELIAAISARQPDLPWLPSY